MKKLKMMLKLRINIFYNILNNFKAIYLGKNVF